MKRLTNKASLWFVPVVRDENKGVKVCKVPPMEYPSPEAKRAGVSRYEKQKAERKMASKVPTSLVDDWVTSLHVSSRSELVQLNSKYGVSCLENDMLLTIDLHADAAAVRYFTLLAT